MAVPEMIDVFQKYQGTIDWHEVWDDNVRMVAVKLTNGPIPASPAGDSYVDGARAVGMRVGGYHYALGGDPAFQAHVFAGELVRLVALGIAPALDFEDSSLPTNTTDRRAWIVDFFVELKATLPRLTKVLLYSSGSELQAIAASSITVPGLVVLDWDAEFGPNDGAPHPIVHYTGTAAVHQYTSAGRLAGVPTLVDEDEVLVDITEAEEIDVQFTDVVPQDAAPGTVGAALNNITYGQDNVRPAGPLALAVYNTQIQVAAIAGALPAEHADLLAAIHAEPAAQVDPAALMAAGLPQQVVDALLASISKAASSAAPIPTGGTAA